MSEEEIIKIIKEYLSKIYIECTKVGAVSIPNEEWYAIEGLLDLYNKEKEKNKEYLKNMNYWKSLYDSTFNELQQEKEKNIPLIIDGKSINAYADEIEDLLSIEDGTPVYFSIGERQAIKIISQYCRNSIPKAEIRELKEKTHKTLDGNGITRAYQLEIDGYFNKVLEEE